MKKIITTSLILSSLLLATESIYDGTGSLINSVVDYKNNSLMQPYSGWGWNKDTARMHPYPNKTSMVTFQWIYNNAKCHHIDLFADENLQVKVVNKGWAKIDGISYEATLPAFDWNKFKNGIPQQGISFKYNDNYNTIAVASAQPLIKRMDIYAVCKSSLDYVNESYGVNANLPLVDTDRYWMGNASLITLVGENSIGGSQGIYGVKEDEAITSTNSKGVAMFQILSSNECRSVVINNKNGNSINLDSIWIKGWDESVWLPTDCDKLPCGIKLPSVNGRENYTLIKAMSNGATREQSIEAKCENYNSTAIKKLTLNNQKDSSLTHPTNCQFYDVLPKDSNGLENWAYKYVTALCSAGIVKGYNDGNAVSDGKAYFGASSKATGMELAKVIHYAHSQNKMRALIEEKGWTSASREMANKYSFGYVTSQNTVTRGLTLQYVVKVFWDKDMSPSEAGQFLLNQKVIHGVEGNGVIDDNYLNTNLNRVEMAKIVFNSATMSATDNAVERKLSYNRHIPSDNTPELDTGKKSSTSSKSTEIVEPDVIQTISRIVTNIKKAISENIKSVEENGSPYVSKTSTDPMTVSLSILGIPKVEDQKGEKLEEKSIEEVAKILDAKPLSNPTKNDIDAGDILIMIDKGTNEQTTGVVDEDKTILITTGVKTEEDKGVNRLTLEEINNANVEIDSVIKEEEITKVIECVKNKSGECLTN